METEKTCSTDNEDNPTAKDSDTDFSTSFLTKLLQLQNDEDDEEPVDNSQD